MRSGAAHHRRRKAGQGQADKKPDIVIMGNREGTITAAHIERDSRMAVFACAEKQISRHSPPKAPTAQRAVFIVSVLDGFMVTAYACRA